MERVFIIFLSYLLCLWVTTENKATAIKKYSCSENIQKEFYPLTDSCKRGKPKPALDTTTFPKRKFQRINRTTANEIVKFNNGDKLIVQHRGCEYYVQTYRFESSRFQVDNTDLTFWYKKSVKLLKNIVKADRSQIELKNGIKALNQYIDQKSKKQLGKRIEIGNNKILRQHVQLNNIEHLYKNRFAIEIRFSIGPL